MVIMSRRYVLGKNDCVGISTEEVEKLKLSSFCSISDFGGVTWETHGTEYDECQVEARIYSTLPR